MQDLETRLIELPRWLSSQSLNDFSAPVDKSGTTKAMRAGAKIRGRMRNLAPFLGEDGWTFDDLGADVRLVPIRPALAAERILGDVMLADLRQWLGALTEPRRMLCVVDEFAQLVSTTTDPGDLAASLAETGRSQGVGLVLAAQSLPGISGDLTFRDRLSSSGIAVVIGRSKSPEAAVSLAGTVKRMEASGDATEGAELNTGRAQDTYAIAPQDVREAWDGAFYLIQGGLHTPFRAIPPEVLTSRPDAYVPAVDVDEEADEGEQPPQRQRTHGSGWKCSSRSTARAAGRRRHGPPRPSSSPTTSRIRCAWSSRRRPQRRPCRWGSGGPPGDLSRRPSGVPLGTRSRASGSRRASASSGRPASGTACNGRDQLSRYFTKSRASPATRSRRAQYFVSEGLRR